MKNLPGNKTQVQQKNSTPEVLITTILLVTMAGLFSSCVFKEKQLTKESLPSTKAPSVTPAPLAPTPSPTPTPDRATGWKTYTNQEYKFEVNYPPEWTPETNTQVLEEGDLFSVVIVGKTQKPRTEFYDGAQLTIGIPVQTNQDVKAWVQDNYPAENIHGEPNQFSEETIGSLTFQKIYTCGLGCFTYYHVKSGSLIYQIVVLAEGPDKTEYEQILSKMLSSFEFLP